MNAFCDLCGVNLREKSGGVGSTLLAAAILSLALGSVSVAQTVTPVDWSRYAGIMGVKPGDTFGQTVTGIMQKQAGYLSSWLNGQYTTSSDGTGQRRYNYATPSGWSHENAVLPLAEYALGNAVLINTGAYNAGVSGISQSQALAQSEMAIRGAALTHIANQPTGSSTWGNEWESAWWASNVATGAWMLWGNLSASTQQAVKSMVQYEANRFLNYQVPYWKNPNGTTNYPGDTKAEENAWNGHLLSVAQAMMPNASNAPQWRAKASELFVSAYSRPSDLTNTKLVDGKPVKDWLHGYNAYDNGLVVNHNIVHPDYMACTILSNLTVIEASLAKQYIPQSALFNSDVVYNALTTLSFTPGPSPWGSGNIVAPGGTIYTKSGQGPSTVYNPGVYYPQGTDWTTKSDYMFSLEDVFAVLQGLDGGNGDAMGWANSRVNAVAALQARPGHTGNVFQPGDYTTIFVPAETDAFVTLAEDWTVWWLMQNGQVSPVGDHWGALPVPEPNTLYSLLTCGCGVLLYYGIARRKRFLWLAD
jgi:hypothetical protein